MNVLQKSFTSLKNFFTANDVKQYNFVTVPEKKLEDGTTRPSYRVLQFVDEDGVVLSFENYPAGHPREGEPMPFTVGLSKELTKQNVRLTDEWLRKNAKSLQIAHAVSTESGRDTYSLCLASVEAVSVDMSMFD